MQFSIDCKCCWIGCHWVIAVTVASPVIVKAPLGLSEEKINPLPSSKSQSIIWINKK